MLVQRVLMPTVGAQSWTVLDDEGEVIEPVERYSAAPRRPPTAASSNKPTGAARSASPRTCARSRPTSTGSSPPSST